MARKISLVYFMLTRTRVLALDERFLTVAFTINRIYYTCSKTRLTENVLPLTPALPPTAALRRSRRNGLNKTN